jgi:hypothetical protein
MDPMAEQTKRQQLQQYLAVKALQDPEFREKLLEAPKPTIEEEMGLNFPATLDVLVHEERLNTLHVVLHVDLETTCALPSGPEITAGGNKLTFWEWMRRARG